MVKVSDLNDLRDTILISKNLALRRGRGRARQCCRAPRKLSLILRVNGVSRVWCGKCGGSGSREPHSCAMRMNRAPSTQHPTLRKKREGSGTRHEWTPDQPSTCHLQLTHQTRQAFSGIIGWPTLQPKALPNSGKFSTVPFTRHWPELCGSVFASTRELASRTFSHQTCAKPMK